MHNFLVFPHRKLYHLLAYIVSHPLYFFVYWLLFFFFHQVHGKFSFLSEFCIKDNAQLFRISSMEIGLLLKKN